MSSSDSELEDRPDRPLPLFPLRLEPLRLWLLSRELGAFLSFSFS